MKIFIKLFLLVLVTTIISCRKEKPAQPALTGTWELRHVNGVQIAGMSPDFPPGNGNIIKFTASEFQQFSKGTLIRSEKYTIIKEEAIVNFDKVSYRLIYDTKDKFPLNPYFKLEGNKLTLYIGIIAADGVEEIYERR